MIARLLVRDIACGFVLALLSITIATSCAAIIFTGPMAASFPIGVGLGLLSAAVLGLTGAIRSSIPFAVIGPQPAVAAVLAVMVLSIAASTASPDLTARTLPTIRAAIVLTTVATAVVLLILGRLRLGRVVRFLPFPVVGGLLAATGWLVFKGGLTVLLGWPITVRDADRLLDMGTLARALPGVVFGIALLVFVPRTRHPLALPALILAGFAAFHVAARSGGLSPAEAADGGWVIGPATGSLLELWDPRTLGEVEWASFSHLGPAFLTVQAVVIVTLLLNVAGIEVATSWGTDVDRELRAAGAANLLTGLAGGMVGYHAPSPIILNHTIGSRGRIPGIVNALVCAAVLFCGGAVLAYLPRPVLGGLLLFVGAGLMLPWLYHGWSRFSPGDYAIVLGILLVSAVFGFLAGIAFGLVGACALFALRASGSDPVRAALDMRGGAVHIVVLHGHLFFGNATAVVVRLTRRLRTPNPPRFLLLDLRLVTTLDSSAAISVDRLRRAPECRCVSIGLVAAPGIVDELSRGGLLAARDPEIRVFDDLDSGLRWCEDELLREHDATAAGRSATPVDAIAPTATSTDPHRDWSEHGCR
jgi:sulfate permease, SulP family